jgi:hypothetical protein
MRVERDRLSSEMRSTLPVVQRQIARAGYRRFQDNMNGNKVNEKNYAKTLQSIVATQVSTSMPHIFHCCRYLAHAAFD